MKKLCDNRDHDIIDYIDQIGNFRRRTLGSLGKFEKRDACAVMSMTLVLRCLLLGNILDIGAYREAFEAGMRDCGSEQNSRHGDFFIALCHAIEPLATDEKRHKLSLLGPFLEVKVPATMLPENAYQVLTDLHFLAEKLRIVSLVFCFLLRNMPESTSAQRQYLVQGFFDLVEGPAVLLKARATDLKKKVGEMECTPSPSELLVNELLVHESWHEIKDDWIKSIDAVISVCGRIESDLNSQS